MAPLAPQIVTTCGGSSALRSVGSSASAGSESPDRVLVAAGGKPQA